MITHYKECAKCILDTSDDPLISFDDTGVCNHCRAYQQMVAEYVFKGEEGKKRLNEIVEKIKIVGKHQEYDCIIGLSGGVDSSYVAYYVVKKLGLRPLVIHFDNGWNSELAVKNIENIVKKLNIDLYTYVVNWEEFKDIQLSLIKASVVDIEMVTDHAIIAVTNELARKNGIKYIISGGNLATESWSFPKHWIHDKHDWLNIKSIHKQFGTVKIKTFPHFSFLKKFYYYTILKIETIEILNYLDFNKAEAKELLKRDYDWKDYGGKHYESIFTKFYQSYILPVKFKIDKRKQHLSSMIGSGQLTREAAKQEIGKVLNDDNQLRGDKEYVIKKLGLTADEFEKLMLLPVKKHTDYPNYSKYYEFVTFFYKKFKPLIKMVRVFIPKKKH